MPKLSIGIPVFNGQEFLPELLDSLLTQTFREFEIVAASDPLSSAFSSSAFTPADPEHSTGES